MDNRKKIKYLMVSCSSLPVPRPRSYQIAKMLLHLKGNYRLITSDYPTKEKLDTSLNDIYANIFNKKIIVKENLNGLLRRLLFTFLPWSRIIPDDHVFWINEVCKRAKKLKVEIVPEVIVAFGRPHSDLIIGMKLKNIFQVPLVIHLSDPWVDNPYAKTGALVKKINGYYEQKVMMTADLIFFTNKDQLQLVMQKYPAKIRQKARVLNHCFEPKLYEQTQSNSEIFIISHVGNLYGQRSPTPFLEAVALLLSRQPELKEKIQINFFGQISDIHKQQIFDYDLDYIIKLHGSVSYLESLQVMHNSNLLLLIDAESEHNIFFPSKLADYIGAKRRILGISSLQGPSYEIIKSNGGSVFQHNQISDIRNYLSHLLINQPLYQPKEDVLRKFDASFVAKEFENLISPLLESN